MISTWDGREYKYVDGLFGLERLERGALPSYINAFMETGWEIVHEEYRVVGQSLYWIAMLSRKPLGT